MKGTLENPANAGSLAKALADGCTYPVENLTLYTSRQTIVVMLE
ncbi:hypothetical protein SpAn4DRAFT_5009 [Sporomusa ovata]|uniref:Uncharacterized protein n=1 Tax=Sporomusa ovata TaxID=2378 RepID=A0A0U1KX01_9FIRM|nr:hypothetical protein [Sporomusa ovata]CQR71947.1 hypothetical protein SpAn4DRAFT_5009 [Sporomusa ovata]